jgi:sugar/nucleoside kinase (ribokinase family)
MNNSQTNNSEGYDVLAIGSPLLDVIIYIDDEHLKKLNFRKGSMNLISKKESESILAGLDRRKKESKPGGSAANTLSGVNTLGNKTAFLGVIGNDDHGRRYRNQTEGEGVVSHLVTHDEQATGHSLILITPDGERTMLTHLGAALSFHKLHIDHQKIASSKILHIEAYQLENPDIINVLYEAIAIAKQGGAKVSLDLSDANLIARNKELFESVVREHIDIIFANEDEAKEFTGKFGHDALDEFAKHVDIAVVKLGSKGSLIKQGEKTYVIEPHDVEMLNTNGAGDMYAAGILHGLVNGLDLGLAGEIASHVSALVVASPGARLDRRHYPEIQKYKK